MAQTFVTPERSLRKVTWFDSVAAGAPVVKLHDSGRASPPPPAAVITSGATSTSNVVFDGSGPDAVNRSTRPPSPSPGSSPGSETTSRVPATSGVILSASPFTESGSIARSKMIAMAVFGAMPSTPSAGTRRSTRRPGSTVRKVIENASSIATPAASVASPLTRTSYDVSGRSGSAGTI